MKKFDYDKECERGIEKWEDLIMHASWGREIEFSFNGIPYFLQPSSWNEENESYDEFLLYATITETEGELVLRGTSEQIVDYQFNGGYTLRENFEKFKLDYMF